MMTHGTGPYVLGASEVSANMFCNSRTSVLGRLRNYLRLLMGRTLCVQILKLVYCLNLTLFVQNRGNLYILLNSLVETHRFRKDHMMTHGTGTCVWIQILKCL